MADTTRTTTDDAPDTELLQEMVAQADTGGRKPRNRFVASLIACLAIAWSLWQLFYASPLPFTLGWGIINDTQAREIYLGRDFNM